MTSLNEKINLKIAFTQQPGEEKPRVIVKRDGQPVPYETLEAMTSPYLVGCDIIILGKKVSVTRDKSFDGPKGPAYRIMGGVGMASTWLHESQTAAQGLESFYALGRAILSRVDVTCIERQGLM